jgi:starvation-inducible DNA-binding protein
MQLVETAKPYSKLGYKKIEVAEIVSKWNIALSTYQIFFHKAQNFHWNVVGSDFFDIHDLTEKIYRTSLEDIDMIAERIRVFGETPRYRMNEYISESLISETTHDKSGEFMMIEMTGDIQALIEALLDTHEFATKNGDVSSIKLSQDIIAKLETYHWKLTSWLNQRFNNEK